MRLTTGLSRLTVVVNRDRDHSNRLWVAQFLVAVPASLTDKTAMARKILAKEGGPKFFCTKHVGTTPGMPPFSFA